MFDNVLDFAEEDVAVNVGADIDQRVTFGFLSIS